MSLNIVFARCQVTEDDCRSLLYCDFSDPKSDSANYIEVRDVEQLRHIVEGYLEEYNNLTKKPMNLVMFRSGASGFGCRVSKE